MRREPTQSMIDALGASGNEPPIGPAFVDLPDGGRKVDSFTRTDVLSQSPSFGACPAR